MQKPKVRIAPDRTFYVESLVRTLVINFLHQLVSSTIRPHANSIQQLFQLTMNLTKNTFSRKIRYRCIHGSFSFFRVSIRGM